MTKKKRGILTDSGFTLLEIILVVTILAVVSAFGVGIISSIRGMTDNTATINRMNVIVQKVRDYYRGHGALPASATVSTLTDLVPTGSSALDLEQKYRLDAWGQYFKYYAGATIVGISVDSQNIAGVLISGGPNEVIDSGTTTPFTTAVDDILVPVNVSAQAVEIALEELGVLREKVYGFDKFYNGVDNDGDGLTDEETVGCQAISTTNYTGCPPNPAPYLTDTGNDSNCGGLTLDNIESGSYPVCSALYSNALDFIVNWNRLGDEYLQDPWGNNYVWGDGSLGASDPRYHKFYSCGQNGTPGDSDDIIP